MAQQRVTFEWVIEENPAEGEQPFGNFEEVANVGLSAREQVLVTYLLRAFSLLFVIFFTTAAAGLTPEERRVRDATQGINFTLRLEEQAWHTRDRPLFESLSDPRIDEVWVDEWVDIWRDGLQSAEDFDVQVTHVRETHGVMHASLLVDQPLTEWWHTSPMREERFYRRVNGQWLRTLPPPEYWGEPRELATEHLQFTYYERDAAAVEGAAEKLSDAYAAMYRLLGLNVPAGRKYTIAVVPEPVGRWNLTGNTLEVTSPKLTQVPHSQSEADFLAYDAMGWFTYRVFRDAPHNTAGHYLYRWPLLVWGLRGWLRHDLLPDTSPWRAEAMAVLQESDRLPLGLKNVSSLNNETPTREAVIVRYLAAESFVAFVVDTYGRDRLPELLQALVRGSNWDAIIPDLYGHSAEKFVADWNLYIMEHYTPEKYAPES